MKLIVAACNGDYAEVRRLIHNGADLEEEDDEGCTALFWATLMGHKAIVYYLIAADAEPTVVNNKGLSLMHCVAMTGDTELAEYFMLLGVTFSVDNKKRSPLHVAVENDKLDMALFLARNGADLDSADYKARTPIDIAKTRGHTHIIADLEILKFTAPINYYLPLRYSNDSTSDLDLADSSAEHSVRHKNR